MAEIQQRVLSAARCGAGGFACQLLVGQTIVFCGLPTQASRLAAGKDRSSAPLVLLSVLLAAACACPALLAQQFYPDDPLQREPPPLAVKKPLARPINDYYDFFRNTFWPPDKEELKHHDPAPSQAVNTLGEVPDSAWFTNRIGARPLSLEELVAGPGTDDPPAPAPGP